jgi:hypothetical protein
MENFYLVFLAFLKIFKGMVLTFCVSTLILFIVIHVKGLLHASNFKTIYNRFNIGGFRK